MKHLFFSLAFVCAASGTAGATSPPANVEAPRLVALKGPRPEAKSPGKPAVPVRVTSSLVGEVTPEKELPVVVTVTATGVAKGSGTLRVRLRGLDGVVLVAGEPLRVPVKPLAPQRLKARVRVPKGVVGALVVDVLLELEGKHMATSQAFTLAAAGASPAAEIPGRLVQGSDGQEVLVLEPSAKK